MVMPELERLFADREHVLGESNSILEFWRPDVYVPVLRYDVNDFKPSSRRFLDRAHAFVVVASAENEPRWPGIGRDLIEQKPVFRVTPPEYDSPELTAFCTARLKTSTID